MAGGVLKGFGVFFIVIGSLAIVVGLVAAAFGAYMYNEEEGRGLFGDQEKAEGGVVLGVGGLGLAGIGLVALLLGILLYALGARAARRELMDAVAATGVAASASRVPIADAPSAGLAHPLAPHPPAEGAQPPRARRAAGGGKAVPVVLGVLALAAILLVLLLAYEPGGASPRGSADLPPPQVETFEGNVQGVSIPLGSSPGTAHPMDTAIARGVVRGSLNWTSSGPSETSLVLVLEVREGDAWVEQASGEGGPGLTVETPVVDTGGEVRAHVFIGGSAGASQGQAYTLTLTVLPAA